MIISQNGKIVGASASISIFDIAVTRGISAFEFLRTYHEKPFHLEDHIEKLFKAARLLGLVIEMKEEELLAHTLSLLALRAGAESQIKLLLLGKDEFSRLSPTGDCSLFVIISDIDSFEKKPLSLLTVEALRILPEIKTTSYAGALVAIQRARKLGFDDILYKNHLNHLLESSTSNIFFMQADTIHTPNAGILEGVTRSVVLRELSSHFSFIQRPILESELSSFEGAFLTSSVREIVPIYRINDIYFPNKCEAVRALYQEITLQCIPKIIEESGICQS